MTVVDPLRLRVLKNLCDALKDISTANGYRTELNSQVYRGRVVYGDNDPLPICSVLEVPIPLDQTPPPRDSEFSSGDWELMIQGFVEDTPDNPTDPAHVFMADVKKRLVVEKRKAYADKPEDGILGLGNYVTDLRIGSGVVRPPDEISAKAYFWLTITLSMAEDLFDPYAE